MLWQTFSQFLWNKDQDNLYNQNNVRKKVYNKYIIKIVTWSGVQYHVSLISLDASRLVWSDDISSSTRCDTVRQIKLLL